MKSKTNGFGSLLPEVYVIVEKPYDRLLETSGWAIIDDNQTTSTFRYYCKNRYRGDDETIVFNLHGELPKDLDFEKIKIDWENSTY